MQRVLNGGGQLVTLLKICFTIPFFWLCMLWFWLPTKNARMSDIQRVDKGRVRFQHRTSKLQRHSGCLHFTFWITVKIKDFLINFFVSTNKWQTDWLAIRTHSALLKGAFVSLLSLIQKYFDFNSQVKPTNLLSGPKLVRIEYC